MAAARPGRPAGRPLSEAVRAAGGVVVRGTGAGTEVLLVHRPAYDDWTFPKGKCEPGETDEACAVREVEEETGLRCSLGRELPSTAYVDARGRSKVVRYWLVEVVGGALQFEHEVDEARWATSEDAAELLTYERDLDVLREAIQLAHYARRVGNWPEVVTPSDIAAHLKLGGERPDKAVRAWLRDIHPGHVRYQRWKFTPSEANGLVKRWRTEQRL